MTMTIDLGNMSNHIKNNFMSNYFYVLFIFFIIVDNMIDRPIFTITNIIYFVQHLK